MAGTSRATALLLLAAASIAGIKMNSLW